MTKRGERAFAGGRRTARFFRERADWVFVASLIDATLGEKNKLLRAWLTKVCPGEVDARRSARERPRGEGLRPGILREHLHGNRRVSGAGHPELAQLPPVSTVTIGPGLNVMDLSRYSTELQSVVIKSVLEHVYKHEGPDRRGGLIAGNHLWGARPFAIPVAVAAGRRPRA